MSVLAFPRKPVSLRALLSRLLRKLARAPRAPQHDDTLRAGVYASPSSFSPWDIYVR
jgi:hypothetical protein